MLYFCNFSTLLCAFFILFIAFLSEPLTFKSIIILCFNLCSKNGINSLIFTMLLIILFYKPQKT